MKLSEFKFELPPGYIALYPSENRDESRLMVLDRKKKTIEHKVFKDIVDYFDDGDVMIMNDTKVFPPGYMETRRKQVRKSKYFF